VLLVLSDTDARSAVLPGSPGPEHKLGNYFITTQGAAQGLLSPEKGELEPAPVCSHRWLDIYEHCQPTLVATISLGGNVYTTEIGRWYHPGFVFLLQSLFPAHTWLGTSYTGSWKSSFQVCRQSGGSQVLMDGQGEKI
jgi:hypothetical protein